MSKDKKPTKFIQTPQYPGGREALKNFITSNLKYPKKAEENEIEGLVVLVIDIDQNGKVIRTRPKKKLGYGCDEEADRVAKMLEFLPVNNRKMKVVAHRTINFGFKKPKTKVIEKKILPKPQEISQGGFTISYTYVPKKKDK